MKKTFMLTALLVGAILMTIGQTDYKMWQLVYLKALPGADMEAAAKAMADHNKTFHPDGKYHASVWANSTGSRLGTLVWVMGPATFTDHDARPSGKDHDGDWRNVMKYFKIVSNEYWKLDEKKSYVPEDFKYGDKVVWTIYDIAPGEGYRFAALLEKIAEVYKQKKYDHNFAVYWNKFDNKEGRDVAIEVSFSKWAFMDEDRTMKKDFEEVHGEGSWWKAIEEYRDCVISSEDEVSVLIPEMSAPVE